MSSEWDVDNYKIMSLIDASMDDVMVNMLNFKTDLRPDIALEKSVFMQDDGRPFYKELKYQDVPYAIVNTFYKVDELGLLERKIKYLHYIKNDGTLSPAIVISDKRYGLGDTPLVIDEKKQARHNILSKIKSDILLGLIWANPTLPHDDIIGMGVTFAHDTDQFQRDFEDYGYPFFREFVEAIDTTDPGYEWMETPVSSEENMKDYIVNSLTYTSATTLLEE